MSLDVYPPQAAPDYYLAIAKGEVAGHSQVNKFGSNDAVATSSTETIWDGSNLYTLPTSASITHIRQAVDQTAMRGETIEIQGLDTNYALVVQTANLNVTSTATEVTLGTALRRVFRMKALSSVVTTQDVWVGATGMSAATANGIIQAGNNQTLMALYCIPAAKSGYISNYWASLNKISGGGDPNAIIRMWHQDNENGYAPQLKHLRGLDADASSVFRHEFTLPLKLSAKTDIFLTAENLSGTAVASVTAGFDIILVDN